MKHLTLKLAAIGLMLVITNQSAMAAEPGVIRIKDDSVKPAASRIVKKLSKTHANGCGNDGCCNDGCTGTGCGTSCTTSSGPKLCYKCAVNGKPHCTHREFGVCKECEKQLRENHRLSQKFTREANRVSRNDCRDCKMGKCPRCPHHPGRCPRECRECRGGGGPGDFKYRLADRFDRFGKRFACKFGYFIPTGGDGKGLPPFGHYGGVYAVDAGHSHPSDRGSLYATEAYNVPVSVPIAPNVHKQWNYSWGTPSSRITPISNYRGY